MKRILLVDNEAEFGYFVKQNLEALGDFEVAFCSESRLAFQTAKEFHPDLIFLDILMPGLLGPEVAVQLGRDPQTRNIPVVFLSVAAEAEPDGENVVEGHPVLPKPVAVTDLLRTIQENS